MTLEESREVIPIMESMINQIEEQQNLMAEMVQELQEKDRQLLSFQEQNQSLQILNSELSGLLNLLPDTEALLSQIEQQNLMAEMILEMQNRDTQLSLMQKQNQKLQKLNNELSELLNILPNTEELLSKMEEQKTKIELLENENQQWQKLAQKLNSENSLLLKQNTELLNWNSR